MDFPKDCTGCYACVSSCPTSCISMQENYEGFLYPCTDNNRCINCMKCAAVCPLNFSVKKTTPVICYAAKSNHTQERMISSSGGVFSVLAKHVLKQGGFVFGAAYDSDFQVKHIMIDSVDQLPMLQGTKYAQSIIGDSLEKVRDLLISEKLVLFSGTPCQVGGLLSYLNKKYNNLITIDLICHGVPSPMVWKKYLLYRQKKDGFSKKPKAINLRSKVTGWSRYRYSIAFDYGGNNIINTSSQQDLFMKVFIGNFCIRDSCSRCKFKGVDRCSDYTIGDYWGIWNQYPDFDDDRGVSAILIHSEEGRQIFKQVIQQLTCLKVTQSQICMENPSVLYSSKRPVATDDFFSLIKIHDFENVIDRYFRTTENKGTNVVESIKRKIKCCIHR